jgi:intraflagellar transport protein 81
MDKRILKQQYELEDYEDRLLLSRQRLLDCKKNLSEKVSAFELLESVRNQRNTNRETSENLAKFEIVDRKIKIKSLEEILMMPEISYEEVNKMKKDQLALLNEIQKLENKVANSASNSSELTIFKQNTIQATNKKETALKILEKMEKEKALLEQKYSDLEKKYEQTKGFKFVRKDDILQQAENVKRKKEIYVKYNKILDNLKGESLILDRTISLLKNKTPEGELILKKFEEKNGGSLNAAKKELEELSRKKQEIDLNKALTLEEYSKLIGQIRLKMQQSQMKHAPLIEEHEKCKKEYETLNSVCSQKKQIFDMSVADIQSNYNKVKDVYVKFESQFRESQNKYHQLNISLGIVDEMIKRSEAEISFTKKKDKRLNDKYKSYNDYYKAILNEQENFLRDLKEKQKKIKESYEDNTRQVIYIYFIIILDYFF